MLAIPALLAATATWPLRPAAVLSLASLLLFFLARYAALPVLRGAIAGKTECLPRLRYGLWAAIYGGGGAACLAALLAADPAALPAAVPALALTGALSVAHTALAAAGRERALGAKLLALSAFASTAPLLMALDGEAFDSRSLGVASLALGYFLSTLVHVRVFQNRSRGARRHFRACLQTQVVTGALVMLLWFLGLLPPVGLAILLPVLVRIGWEILRPPKDLRALGLREMGAAAGFLAAAAAFVT
jgi:hypothetical protein